jgi:ATP-dependent Clp protease ATP-binding subunit ClpA
MGVGLGVKMMWPLAAQEAEAGGSSELEPGHFLCAALKLAEMPASVFQDVLLDKRLVAVLEEDQRGLRQTLAGLGLRVPADSTPFRRGLRRLLRKDIQEGPRNRGEAIHRSAAARALFARAEAEAREAGEKEIAAGRLVEILLSAPDEDLAAALARIGDIRIDARPAAGKVEIEWLEAYGSDLTRRAREMQSDATRLEKIRCDAVCRVLAEVLFAGPGGKRSPLLLISQGERSAAAVVNDLAHWLVSSKPPTGFRRGRLLEIHSPAILNRETEGSPEARLEKVFQHLEGSKSSILFFDHFHRYLTPSIAGEGLLRRFQTFLKDSGSNCIMGMTEKQYEVHIEQAVSWRKVFRLIWIHDVSPSFQL